MTNPIWRLALVGLLVVTVSSHSLSAANFSLATLEGAFDDVDAEAVTTVFRAYKAALVAGDGAAAAKLVDSATYDYFGGLKELAVSGSAETVKARPFVDRLLIISMRQIMEPEELKQLELGELMNRAVAEGWISPQTVSQLDIGDVSVEGNRATAEALSLNPAVSLQAPSSPGSGDGASDEDVKYQFRLEDGEWKFGFSSLVESLNRLVEDFTAQLGTDQDELIFVLVQSLTGKAVLPDVWEVPEASADDPP